ncbi:hypothetical protein WMF38_18480 [Sorangium sp. So ce118]
MELLDARELRVDGLVDVVVEQELDRNLVADRAAMARKLGSRGRG